MVETYVSLAGVRLLFVLTSRLLISSLYFAAEIYMASTRHPSAVAELWGEIGSLRIGILEVLQDNMHDSCRRLIKTLNHCKTYVTYLLD